MISALAWLVLAGTTGNTSAFDPKNYIKTLPVDESDAEDEEEPAPATAKAETAATPVLKADVTVDGKSYVALRSSFGTIYVAKSDGINGKGLASASCANTRPAPSLVGPDLPLAGDDTTHETEVLKAIESHCKPAARSKTP